MNVLPIIEIQRVPISMYGLMIVIGAFLGVYIGIKRSNKYHIEREDVIFSSCFAAIGLIIGAKLLYIITAIPTIIKHKDIVFSSFSNFKELLSGGFVFYGGLIGAVIGFYIYSKQYKINIIDLLDLMAPSIPLIHGFGRLGCFFAGCCYGIEYSGPFHIIFHKSLAAPNGIPLFPIQVLESGLNFIAFIILLIYGRKLRSSGKLIGAYIVYYSIARFFLEFLRGDVARGIFWGISTSQWISLPLLAIGILFILGKIPKKD